MVDGCVGRGPVGEDGAGCNVCKLEGIALLFAAHGKNLAIVVEAEQVDASGKVHKRFLGFGSGRLQNRPMAVQIDDASIASAWDIHNILVFFK